MLNDELAETLSEIIARDLFTNGQGERGQRLVMIGDGDKDLGGWGESAVKSRVKKYLTGELLKVDYDALTPR